MAKTRQTTGTGAFRRWLRRAAVGAVVIVVLLVGLAAGLVAALNVKPVRNAIATLAIDTLREDAGLAVEIGDVGGTWPVLLELRDITVSDDDGPFLFVEGFSLQWRPAALWGWVVHVPRIEATTVRLDRLPAGGAGGEPGGLSFPTSMPAPPVAIVVDEIVLNNVRLPPGLLAGKGEDATPEEAVAIDVSGSLRLAAEGLDGTLSAWRRDPVPGRLDASLTLDRAARRFALKLALRDGGDDARGAVAALLGRADAGPSVADISLSGDEGTFSGEVRARSGTAIAADMKVAGEFAMDGGGDAPVLAISLRPGATVSGAMVAERLGAPFRTDNVGVSGRVALYANGVVTAREIRVTADPFVLAGGGDADAPTVNGDRRFRAEGTVAGLGALMPREMPPVEETPWRMTGVFGAGGAVLLDAAMLDGDWFRLSAGLRGGTDEAAVSGRLDLAIPDLAVLSEAAGRPLGGTGRAIVEPFAVAPDGGVTGDVSLFFENLRLGVEPVDRLLGRGAGGRMRLAVSGDGAIGLSDIRLASRSYDAVATGDVVFSAEETIEADLRLSMPDAEMLLPDAGVGGALSAKVALSGPVGAPRVGIDATLDAARLPVTDADRVSVALDLDSGLKGTARLSLNRGETPLARLVAETDLAPADAVAAFGAIDGNVLGVPVAGDLRFISAGEDILAAGRISGSGADLRALANALGVAASGEFAYTVTLEAAGREQGVVVTLNAPALALDDGPALDGARIEARLRDLQGAPAVEARLDASGGRVGPLALDALTLTADGDADAVRLRLDASGRRLSLLRQPVVVTASATGGFKADLVTLDVDGFNATVGEDRITLEHPTRVTIRSRTISLDRFSLNLAANGERGILAASAEYAPDGIVATAEARTVPLHFAGLFYEAERVEGRVDGNFTIDTRRGEGDLALQFADVRFVELYAGTTPPFGSELSVRWRDGRAAIEGRAQGVSLRPFELKANVPLRPAPGAALPYVPESEPLSGTLTWTGPVQSLMALADFPDHRLQGNAVVDLALSGTVAAPKLNGSVTIGKGLYENFTLGLQLVDLEARLDAEGGDHFRLMASGTDSSGGMIEAEGRLRFGEGLAPLIDLRLTFDKALVVHRDELDLAVNGWAVLSGALGPEGLTLEAEIASTRADLRIPEDLPPSVPDVEFIEVNAPPGRARGPQAPEESETAVPVRLDVRFRIDNPATVSGRGLKSIWSGGVDVRGTIRDPLLDGEFVNMRGSFDFAGRLFDLNRGRVRFERGGNLDPFLDVVAVYARPDFTATVTVGGRASQPEVTLTSNPPLPQDEIMSRVLFGKSVGQLSPFEALRLANALRELTGVGPGIGGVGVLDTLQNSLGLDVLRVESVEGGESAFDTEVIAGKYVEEGVYVGVKQGTTAGSSAVTVEVDVTDQISVDTEFSERAGSDVGVNWRYDY